VPIFIVFIGFYDHDKVRDMLKECLRMSKFDHLHVLTLKGVCLDGGPAPYIIMPFMANGSLLTYLRKNRKALVVCNGSTDDVSDTGITNIIHRLSYTYMYCVGGDGP
jgi:serine/threonine protein kinase